MVTRGGQRIRKQAIPQSLDPEWRYNLHMRRWLAMATLLLAALPAAAQMRARMGAVPLGPTRLHAGGVFFGGGLGFGHNPRFHVFFDQPFFHRRFIHRGFPRAIVPFFVPYYPYYPIYPAASYPTAYTAEPQVVDSGQNRALAAEVDRLRYEVERMRQERDYGQREAQAPAREKAPAREGELVPTVLVFHDGHTETVSNYAIMGQTLWVFSERRARKISLSGLDLDATRKANDEQGVEFRLPARKTQ